MKDNRDFARSWLEKARSDLHAAKKITESSGPYDTACFHAHQTIEKTLKGYLAFYDQPIPRTHDLDELQKTCELVKPIDGLSDLDLSEITDYAVQLRYDVEFWPERQIAERALQIAVRAMQLVEKQIDK
ncbi:MAG: HEPN domain-containing protein [Anaerolineaceae bacterium]